MDFYPTSRKERFFENFHRFIQVFLLFCLGYFTIFAFKNFHFQILNQAYILSWLFFFLLIYRILFFYIRNKWRILGGNSARVIVIGRDRNLKK
nr:hypothetical protein [Christiangramia flava]